MSVRPRIATIVIGLGLLALGLVLAQPSTVPPVTKEPGKPPQITLPTRPATPDAKPVTVTPGPEPWYTVFAIGEVVGFIEPCG